MSHATRHIQKATIPISGSRPTSAKLHSRLALRKGTLLLLVAVLSEMGEGVGHLVEVWFQLGFATKGVEDGEIGRGVVVEEVREQRASSSFWAASVT